MGTMVEDWLLAQNAPIMISGAGEKIFEDIFQHPVDDDDGKEEGIDEVFVEVCLDKKVCKEKHSYITPDIQKIVNEIIPGTPEYIPPVLKKNEQGLPFGYTYIKLVSLFKRIWEKAIGPEYPANFGQRGDIPAFDKLFVRRTVSNLTTGRRSDVEKRYIFPQIEKLCAEAQCMRGNGECNNPCPTPSPHICPHLKDYEK